MLVGEPHLAFRGLPDVREDRGDLLLVQRLLDQQLTDQLVEDVTVLVEDRPRLGVRGLDELQHLLVDDLGRAVGVLARLQTVHHRGLIVIVGPLDGAELRGEAVFDDHLAGDGRGLLDIVRGAGGRVMEDDLLGGATAHRIRHLVEQLVARLRVAVLGRHDGRVAERAASRQDGDLGDRVGVVQRRGDQRVTALMVGGVAQLVEGHALGLALRAAHHAVDGLVDGAVVDELGAGTGAQQRGLVEHVGQVGAGEARRTHGDGVQIHIRHERLALGVHLEDGLTAFQVRGLHGHLTVETTGAQQRGVEHVGTVGGRDDDQVRVVVEAVHLHEQLVQGLLAFVMAAAHAGATAASDGVDLVDEDDGGGVLLRLVEQVAHTGGAETHEHLDEVRAGHRVERHARLAGDGARQQRLTGARRAVQQHAARDAGAERLVLGRVLEEVLDLLDLLHGGVLARHVGELGLGRLAFQQLAVVLLAAHAEHAARAAHAAHGEPEDAEDDDERQDRADQVAPDAGLLHAGGPALGRVGLLHAVDDVAALREGVVELHLLAVVAFTAGVRVLLGEVLAQVQLDELPVVDDVRVGHAAALQQLHAVLGIDGLTAGAGEQLEHQDGQHHNGHAPQPGRTPYRLGIVAAAVAPIAVERVGRPAAVAVIVAAIARRLLRPLGIAHITLLGILPASARRSNRGCGTVRRNPGRNRPRTRRGSHSRCTSRPHPPLGGTASAVGP